MLHELDRANVFIVKCTKLVWKSVHRLSERLNCHKFWKIFVLSTGKLNSAEPRPICKTRYSPSSHNLITKTWLRNNSFRMLLWKRSVIEEFHSLRLRICITLWRFRLKAERKPSIRERIQYWILKHSKK